MKKIYSLALLAFASMSFGQTTITKWDFNASDNTPSTGVGAIALIGGVTATYATGNDTTTGTTDKGLNLTTFPAQNTASGTAGIQVIVSTAGYTGISVSYDRRGSNTSSKWEQFEYSIDNGANWIILGNNGGNLTNPAAGTLWPTTTYVLPSTADNLTALTFRATSIFDPSTSAYVAIGAASTYAGTGTWRFDNLTITGTSLSNNTFSIAGLKVFASNKMLYVTSNSSDDKTVVVYDLVGKVVANETVATQPLNVANLSTGAYIVKVTENGATSTVKILID